MSCEVNTIWKENEFCSISEDLEIGRIDRTEIINQLLETTVWQQADESLIPECQADDDTPRRETLLEKGALNSGPHIHGNTLWPSGPFFLALLLACLLYTSPSPRDRTRSRMPSSA